MNARLPSICWASVADADRAARESRHDAEDAALDEHVKNTYTLPSRMGDWLHYPAPERRVEPFPY